MDRQRTLILNITLNMFLDMRRHPPMHPIRTRTGNMGMNGVTSTITTANGTNTIVTTINSDSRLGCEFVAI